MPRPAGGADPRLSPRRAKARAVPPEAFYLGHPMAPRRHSSSGPPSSARRAGPRNPSPHARTRVGQQPSRRGGAKVMVLPQDPGAVSAVPASDNNSQAFGSRGISPQSMHEQYQQVPASEDIMKQLEGTAAQRERLDHQDRQLETLREQVRAQQEIMQQMLQQQQQFHELQLAQPTPVLVPAAPPPHPTPQLLSQYPPPRPLSRAASSPRAASPSGTLLPHDSFGMQMPFDPVHILSRPLDELLILCPAFRRNFDDCDEYRRSQIRLAWDTGAAWLLPLVHDCWAQDNFAPVGFPAEAEPMQSLIPPIHPAPGTPRGRAPLESPPVQPRPHDSRSEIEANIASEIAAQSWAQQQQPQQRGASPPHEFQPHYATSQLSNQSEALPATDVPVGAVVLSLGHETREALLVRVELLLKQIAEKDETLTSIKQLQQQAEAQWAAQLQAAEASHGQQLAQLQKTIDVLQQSLQATEAAARRTPEGEAARLLSESEQRFADAKQKNEELATSYSRLQAQCQDMERTLRRKDQELRDKDKHLTNQSLELADLRAAVWDLQTKVKPGSPPHTLPGRESAREYSGSRPIDAYNSPPAGPAPANMDRGAGLVEARNISPEKNRLAAPIPSSLPPPVPDSAAGNAASAGSGGAPRSAYGTRLQELINKRKASIKEITRSP
ncbi:hypothetical protein DIPPA_27860 [Diplonema papillatum]|nr:hypothetical protein DIPPA_27860 [Diplonema papillatum]KAJ9446111.1 hypothetical protein DIPPA_27860 [Diplonema papillatum]